jgi:hypothetical protein
VVHGAAAGDDRRPLQWVEDAILPGSFPEVVFFFEEQRYFTTRVDILFYKSLCIVT